MPAEETAAFAGVAERFRRAGELERAVALCREGLHRFPDHLSARVTLGWALMDLRKYNEARAELEQVLKRAPDNLAAIRGLAQLHEHRDVDEVGDVSSHVAWHASGPEPDPAVSSFPAENPAAQSNAVAAFDPGPGQELDDPVFSSEAEGDSVLLAYDEALPLPSYPDDPPSASNATFATNDTIADEPTLTAAATLGADAPLAIEEPLAADNAFPVDETVLVDATGPVDDLLVVGEMPVDETVMVDQMPAIEETLAVDETLLLETDPSEEYPVRLIVELEDETPQVHPTLQALETMLHRVEAMRLDVRS